MTQPPVHPRTSPKVGERVTGTVHALPVVPPFRLDLTVSALRRLPTNPIDVFTADGRYLHAVPGPRHPRIVQVRQVSDAKLEVTIDADAEDTSDHQEFVTLVARTLGVSRDLSDFYRSSSDVPWLDPLARRLRGLKPPRYRSLWEAFVNAVVYQQVSLHAASAVVQRIIREFGTPLQSEGAELYLFPAAESVLAASDDVLRGMGLSANKLATLRRAAEAIDSGQLDAATIEELPSSEAATLLRGIKGIGPWTATVILLRGFGRLDVFPMNDSGVARNLSLATGEPEANMGPVLEALGPHKGMLYFHLLLARLEERGEVGLPSIPLR
jgi:DNA-3-methyladenine glycosylase II